MDFWGLDSNEALLDKISNSSTKTSASGSTRKRKSSFLPEDLVAKFAENYRSQERILSTPKPGAEPVPEYEPAEMTLPSVRAETPPLPLVQMPMEAVEEVVEEEEEETTQFATLTLPNGQSYELEILQSNGGPNAIDIRGLYGKLGLTFYDPGFTSTASCWSEITLIDGPNGRLTHRGYSIEDICDHGDFMDLSFLLVYGELPTQGQRDAHVSSIKNNMMVHQKFFEFYKGFLHNAHPMSIMCSVVGALASFFHDSLDIAQAEDRILCVYRLLAKMPTLAAMAYKTAIGEPPVYPKKCFSYAENFLHMMFSTPCEEYEINPVVAEAMDKFLMLHADHGQNASTSTVRIAGSSQANPYASIGAGITTLWGPSHGGANEAVLNMLQEIGTVDRIPEFIARAKDKSDPFRLMGFGHRVYKNYDPRARVMQDMCHRLLAELNITDEPFLDLARELERIALEDEYFVKRRLFPNVDFYSGIVLKAMGIPRSMFTVLFSLGRTVGWISQWKEMIEDPKQRIGRPRQLYIGSEPREFIPLAERM